MSWWFASSLVVLILCSMAGLVIVAWRQHALAQRAERRRLTAGVESDGLRLRVSALEEQEARFAELEEELVVLRRRSEELEARSEELTAAESEVERLANSVVGLTVEASRAGPLGLELRNARAELEQARFVIGRLEQERAVLVAGSPPMAAVEGTSVALGSGSDPDHSWRDGITDLGTPGANHYDDLKAIRGIGPVMERRLNAYGIHTWEQIAALAPPDIDRLSDALETFPHRIRRDDWIGGAKRLLAEGRTPAQL